MKKIFILMFSSVMHGLFASSPAYDQELTLQLQTIMDQINDPLYRESRQKIQDLVGAGANPNVYRHCDEESLLCRAVLMDDLQLVNCCLEHGAHAHVDADSIKVLRHVGSVPVLQSLIAHKADLTCKEYDGSTLLHIAATQPRNPDLITFLCNAGLEVNAKDRTDCIPLHDLFYMMEYNNSVDENKMLKAAILSWYGADNSAQNKKRESPLDIIRRTSPVSAKQFTHMLAVLPRVKEQHIHPYTNELAVYITRDPARLVMSYVQPAWGNSSLSDLNALMFQQPASKRSRQESKPVKTRLKKEKTK